MPWAFQYTARIAPYGWIAEPTTTPAGLMPFAVLVLPPASAPRSRSEPARHANACQSPELVCMFPATVPASFTAVRHPREMPMSCRDPSPARRGLQTPAAV
jgi:hypothetical protein